MKFDERIRGNIVIIDPKGKLTAESEGAFTETVLKRLNGGWVEVIVNLQDVPYIDSAGLGALVQMYTSAKRRGGRLVLTRVAERNHHLLSITRLVTVFDVYDSEEEAERSFRAARDVREAVSA